MAFLSEKLISASGGVQEETDDSFNLVTSLYSFDGSNGAQNNTLLDSSPESHTVTRNADIVQGLSLIHIRRCRRRLRCRSRWSPYH